jgi:hypothetical protein
MILVVGYSWIFHLCPFMFTYVHLCPFMSTYVHVCPFIIVLRCFKWNVTMSDKLGPLFGGGLLQVSWTDSDFQIERIDMIYPFISIYHILIIYFVWYLPHIYIICSYIYIYIYVHHMFILLQHFCFIRFHIKLSLISVDDPGRSPKVAVETTRVFVWVYVIYIYTHHVCIYLYIIYVY